MATKTVYIFVWWYSTSTFKCTEMKASRRWQVCLTSQTEPVVNSQTLACFLNGSHCSIERQATRQHGLLASLACRAASCLYQSAFTRPKLEAYSWTWPLTKKKKENKKQKSFNDTTSQMPWPLLIFANGCLEMTRRAAFRVWFYSKITTLICILRLIWSCLALAITLNMLMHGSVQS